MHPYDDGLALAGGRRSALFLWKHGFLFHDSMIAQWRARGKGCDLLDAVTFQRLFCPVAGFVGLTEKVAATGYAMPSLAALKPQTAS